MATCFPLKGGGTSTTDLIDMIDGDPLFLPFGTCNLETGEGIDELEQLNIAGIKLYFGYQDPKIEWIHHVLQIARNRRLSVALHMGELHHCCPREARAAGNLRCGQDKCPLDWRGFLCEPNVLDGWASMYPDVNFIAAHLSNPHFTELRWVMARNPNIYTDISGQFLSGTYEDTPAYRSKIVDEIETFLSVFSKRVMFGTDFPIQSYDSTFELVEALKVPWSTKAALLGGTACRLLNL